MSYTEVMSGIPFIKLMMENCGGYAQTTAF